MLLEIKPLKWWHKILDKALHPIMWTMHGFTREKVQETHAWHILRFKNISIDLKLAIKSDASEKRYLPFWFRKKYLGFFHMPVFGGWKKYLIAGPEDIQNLKHWHVGWITSSNKSGANVEVNRIPIKDSKVKILKSPGSGNGSVFFAIDHTGKQIRLKIHGEGTLFDGKYPDTRLL